VAAGMGAALLLSCRTPLLARPLWWPSSPMPLLPPVIRQEKGSLRRAEWERRKKRAMGASQEARDGSDVCSPSPAAYVVATRHHGSCRAAGVLVSEEDDPTGSPTSRARASGTPYTSSVSRGPWGRDLQLLHPKKAVTDENLRGAARAWNSAGCRRGGRDHVGRITGGRRGMGDEGHHSGLARSGVRHDSRRAAPIPAATIFWRTSGGGH